jgi:hypothetical protein
MRPPPKAPPTHSRESLISSITFPYKPVWSWPVGSSRPSPPSPQGQPARGLSWRPLFSSWPNMAARPRRTVRSKALRLACCNADGVRGRKLDLEHFLSQHGVDICLLIETFLNLGQAFRLANYVCHAWRKSRTCSLRLGQSRLETQTSNQAMFITLIIIPGPRRF